MTDLTLTDRQRREREYYETFNERVATSEISFEPISGDETRPWNPYWRVFELAKVRFTPGARLLDFGCGWGTNTVVFAKIGYRVDGIDIAERNIETTLDQARRYGLADRIAAQVSVAERLPFDDETFDAVIGVDILHHVDIASAIPEVHRVLRKGGYAMFREPLEQPFFDKLRNTSLMRALRPNTASLERHITEDERKLSAQDLAVIARTFPSLEIESFRMLSRLDALLPHQAIRLEKLDRAMRAVPGYNWWRGTGVLSMRKEG